MHIPQFKVRISQLYFVHSTYPSLKGSPYNIHVYTVYAQWIFSLLHLASDCLLHKSGCAYCTHSLCRDKLQWAEEAATSWGRDNTPIFCVLTQTCSPKGAKRPYITTVSDVVLLNYPVGLSKDTHYGNTQGVWVCHLPRDCLPLQKLLQSPTFMKDLEKLPRTYRKKTPLQTSKGVS